MSAMKDALSIIEEFERGYIESLLWTNEENAKEAVSDSGRDWEDFDWSAEKIDAEGMTRIREVCTDFVMSNHADLVEYDSKGRNADYAGHDFALSQNGHGTGFWDRGMGDLGYRLHEAAKAYGDATLDLSADGTIYYQG